MSGGKGGGTSTTIPTLSPQQNAMIAAQTGLFTSQIAPAFATAVGGATNLYNQEAPGVTNAAQNYPVLQIRRKTFLVAQANQH